MCRRVNQPISQELQGANDGRSSGYCQCGTAGRRRNSPGGAVDRQQLRISAHDRENRIQFQSVGAGVDLVGERGCTSSSTRPGSATMKQAGPASGLGRYADAIVACSRRTLSKSTDPAMRAAIMGLRGDPQVSAMMAGALIPQQRGALVGAASAARRPKASSISRIFSGPTAPAS